MNSPFLPLLLALILAATSGSTIIKKLKEFKFGQNVRTDGPQSHLSKQGIPSMGGLIFLLSSSFVAILMSGFSLTVILMVLVMLSFGLIGFLDDYLKVKKKSSDGLSAKHKMLLLLLFGLLAGGVLYGQLELSALKIPFTSWSWELGIFYIPFVVIFFAAVTNAVNLTDGIDGLSSSVTIAALLFFALVAARNGQKDILVFAMALMGGLGGFLFFNFYPAKVFMGDTGSLALGGALGILALLTQTELFLLLVGIVYVVETLSVILQVAWFKRTGKRIFRMAPIHHHFEALGWKETKIVAVFTGITLFMVAVSYFLS